MNVYLLGFIILSDMNSVLCLLLHAYNSVFSLLLNYELLVSELMAIDAKLWCKKKMRDAISLNGRPLSQMGINNAYDIF